MDNITLIDWLSFTLPVSYTPESVASVVRDLFMVSFAPVTASATDEIIQRGFDPQDKKANFYRQHFILRTDRGNPLVHVFLSPDADANADTSLFMVTGYALSNRPDALRHMDPVELLRKVKARNGRLTRIDLALDDFSGRPLLSQMIDCSRPDVWRDRIVSKLRFDKPVAIWDETLYFGKFSRSKHIVISAYNKAKEQGVDYPWFRCEFRTKDRDLCAAILNEITEGRALGVITAGLIGEYLQFKPPGIRNKYNRTTCRWWTDFLATGAGFQLQRHSNGKAEDEARKAPTEAAFLRYLNDALRLDETGNIKNALLKMANELQADDELAAAWNA